MSSLAAGEAVSASAPRHRKSTMRDRLGVSSETGSLVGFMWITCGIREIIYV